MRQRTNLPVDLFVIEFPSAEQRQNGEVLNLDGIMNEEKLNVDNEVTALWFSFLHMLNLSIDFNILNNLND